MSKELDEALAHEVHGVYCMQYMINEGKPYWTNGDYSRLEEKIKDFDRALVAWYRTKTNALVSTIRAQEEEIAGRAQAHEDQVFSLNKQIARIMRERDEAIGKYHAAEASLVTRTEERDNYLEAVKMAEARVAALEKDGAENKYIVEVCCSRFRDDNARLVGKVALLEKKNNTQRETIAGGFAHDDSLDERIAAMTKDLGRAREALSEIERHLDPDKGAPLVALARGLALKFLAAPSSPSESAAGGTV